MAREIFEEYIIHLLEKAKERERKREEEKVCAFNYAFFVIHPTCLPHKN